MPEIPSFFNRIDFISILLPGYVPIVAYLLIFRSSILFSEKALSTGIFSSVLFIVAGPALGLTLRQFHRGLSSICSKIRARDSEKKKKDEEFLEQYVAIRLKMTPQEKLELDETEALYDFGISIGLALIGLSIYVLVSIGLGGLAVFFVLLVGGLIPLLGGYIQWSDTYSPMINNLMKKYNGSGSVQ